MRRRGGRVGWLLVLSSEAYELTWASEEEAWIEGCEHSVSFSRRRGKGEDIH